jgi:hypothetical protein
VKTLQKSRMVLALLALLAAAQVLAGPGAHGPNGEHLSAPAVASPHAPARLPDGSVHLPMAAQQRLGLRTALSRMSSVAVTLELPGRVLMDPNAGGRVQTLSGGKLMPGPKGLPVLGQAVRQGEVLAYVAFNANPLEVASQQAQLAELRASRQLAQQRVQRLQSLEGTVPRKDIEAARAELESLTARESALGAGVAAREALLAPVTGVIASASAVAGQVVDAKDVLFEVVDPARALVEALTADASLGPRLGSATLAGLPGVQLQFVGAARALRDGMLPLTFRAASGAALPLAIGQSVTVIAALRQTVQGMALPAQAVSRSSANEPVVWVKVGAERFVPQPVTLQPLNAQTVAVTQGLDADARVVVQGASLLAQIR